MADVTITAYEHERLLYTEVKNFTKRHWEALIAFRSRPGHERYYDVVHKGIKLGSYVGVLRIGSLTLEVLPKLDNGPADANHWRDRLLDMLRVVSDVRTFHPSTSHLRTRPNDLLDYYLTLFADQTEQLLRGGLAKAYHGREGNRTALRGRLVPGKHLTKNALHRERFYVADTVYDYQHPLNQVLRMALDLARRLARPAALRQRLEDLDLRVPRLPELRVSEDLFRRLRYDRRTEAYRPAITIARLLLLNFHPDLRGGQHDVLALLFNMNQLWEGFLLAALRRYGPPEFTCTGQHQEVFWQSERRVGLRPDILIRKDDHPVAVLDAKWKRAEQPSSADLYQLYAYAHHFGVPRVALLYPGEGAGAVSEVEQAVGEYRDGTRCDVLRLPVSEGPVRDWMQLLARGLTEWLLEVTPAPETQPETAAPTAAAPRY